MTGTNQRRQRQHLQKFASAVKVLCRKNGSGMKTTRACDPLIYAEYAIIRHSSSSFAPLETLWVIHNSLGHTHCECTVIVIKPKLTFMLDVCFAVFVHGLLIKVTFHRETVFCIVTQHRRHRYGKRDTSSRRLSTCTSCTHDGIASRFA